MVYMLKSTYDKLLEKDKEPKNGEYRITNSGIEYLKL